MHSMSLIANSYSSAYTVSLLYGAQQKPQTDYKNLRCPPALLSLIITTQPSPAQLGWIHVDSLVADRDLSSPFNGRFCAQINATHPLPVLLCLCLCSLCVGFGGLQTYILHTSLKDDLMGLAAAITILAGVNRNSM